MKIRYRVAALMSAASMLASGAQASEDRNIHPLIEAHKAVCKDLDVSQLRGLKLAAKAQQGIESFMRYVQFNRQRHQWSSEEVVRLAASAATSPCGAAIGLKPIEKTPLADFLIER